MRDRRRTGASAGDAPVMSGKVFIVGTAFLVTGAAWALMGYYQFVDGIGSVGTIDALLAVVHAFAGVLVYRRMPYAVALGAVVVVLGLAAAVLNAYVFLLVPDGLTGLLLWLGRRDVRRMA